MVFVPVMAGISIALPLIFSAMPRLRYFYTGTILLLLPAAWFVVMFTDWLAQRLRTKINQALLFGLIMILTVAPGTVFAAGWLTDPAATSVPYNDYYQYVESQHSGFGMEELRAKIHAEADKAPLNLIVLGTNDWQNHVRIRLDPHPNLTVNGSDNEAVFQKPLAESGLIVRERTNIVIFINNTSRWDAWQKANPNSQYWGNIARPNNTFPYLLFKV